MKSGFSRQLTIALLVGSMATTWAQSSPEAQRSLQEQLVALNSNLNATREELEQSRAEIHELQIMLQEIRAELGVKHSAGAAAAQETPDQDRASARAENESRQVLQSQQRQLAMSKVESASRYPVRLSGLLLFNAFSNRGTVDNQDLPSLAFPRPYGASAGNIGATMRQTLLGIEGSGPDIAGAHTSADVHFDFFGGFPNTNFGVTAGLVRLRTAHIRFDWKNISVIAAQDAPFFSPLSPTSLASLGQPALAWAGNLWTWTPQIEVERRLALNDDNQVSFEMGLLDPLDPGLPNDQSLRAPSHGEQSRQPGYAGRISWTRRFGEQKMTFGAGGFLSPQNYGPEYRVNAWAATADWNIPLTKYAQLSGELYRGDAVGGLGGGLFSSFVGSPQGSQFTGLHSMGAWTQLKVKPLSKLEFNAAIGQDNPFAHDLELYPPDPNSAYASRARNRISFLNFIYKPRSDILFSIEGRHIATWSLNGSNNTADHLSVSAGYLF